MSGKNCPTGLACTLSPDGFIQGVPLTIYVCVLAMLASVLLGLLAALGRLN